MVREVRSGIGALKVRGLFVWTRGVPLTGGTPLTAKVSVLLVVAGVAFSAMPEPAVAQAEVEYFQSETTREMGLPFSDAVRVGDLLFLSGQLGNRPGEMGVVPGGIQAETRQTMENIKSVLEANGSSLDRVFKCLVMMADIDEWPAMNEVYVTYFKDHFPARSAFAGTGLALGARVEIECWASVGQGPAKGG